MKSIVSFWMVAVLTLPLVAQQPVVTARPSEAPAAESRPAAPPPPVDRAVAEKAAAAYAAAISRGTPAEARAFLHGNLHPRIVERMPLDMPIGEIVRAHQILGTVEVERLEPSTRGYSVRLRSVERPLHQDVVFIFDAEPPHWIVGKNMPGIELTGIAEGALEASEIAAAAEQLTAIHCEADAFSGAILLARGDEVLFQRVCGEANRDFGVANTLETRFNLGSMNKMFTAVAIAQLVEAGKMSFDDPLSKFLPDVPTAEAAKQIRIKHLLTHTSGLGNYFGPEFLDASRARYRTIDDYLPLVRGTEPAFAPGTRWAYSNSGFLVLGKVVEQVSGMTYYDYVARHIYAPAGMTRTGELDLDRVNSNLAVGYIAEYSEEGIRYRNNLFEHVIRGGPAGGGYSTAGDLQRFGKALMSGKLVSREMVAILTSAKPELGSRGYGYGFQIDDSGLAVGHTGGFPGISSQLWLFPSNGYVGVVLSNSSEGGALLSGVTPLMERGS